MLSQQSERVMQDAKWMPGAQTGHPEEQEKTGGFFFSLI